MSTIYLCMGKDCRKRMLPRATIDRLRENHSVKNVKCQKICKGPVVGIDQGDGPRWFKKIDSDKARDGLVQYAEGDKLPKPLKKRESTKRAGKLKK